MLDGALSSGDGSHWILSPNQLIFLPVWQSMICGALTSAVAQFGDRDLFAPIVRLRIPTEPPFVLDQAALNSRCAINARVP